MITRQFPIDLTLEYQFDADPGKIAFFDIETTGFSADTTYLYLIGCVYYKDSAFHLIQWFSEDIREEAQLITEFFHFLEHYDLLVHYNGSGFDIPYIQRKCTALKLDFSFDRIKSLDIYKRIYPYKKIFKLSSFKQKSIEKFLKLHREDVNDGGDLIQMYAAYLGKKRYEVLRNARMPQIITEGPSEADELLRLLLLHNEDDIKGLVGISSILNYTELFEKPVHILTAGVNKDLLIIQCGLSSRLPVRISFGNDLASVSAFDSIFSLTVHIYEGELKFFYNNYKDYYYLPQEDRAVHKSVALFVDKEFREKAKPYNCYTRKQGLFAPQYDEAITPCFKVNYQDKLSFLEIHTDFLLQEENLERYVFHMLNYLIHEK